MRDVHSQSLYSYHARVLQSSYIDDYVDNINQRSAEENEIRIKYKWFHKWFRVEK